MNIKIGDYVQDVVTRIKGVVTAYSICLNNCDRVSIQLLPDEEDEKTSLTPEDAYWIDVPQCKLIKANYLDPNFIIQSKEHKVKLGDTVKHIYTGLEGYVTQIAIWISGCTRISIQPVGINKKTGGVYESTWVSVEEVEVINQALIAPVKTGGPFDVPKKMSVPKKY